jgi:hypothetical protein
METAYRTAVTLHTAACNAGTVLPMAPIELPLDADGCPSWQHRKLPGSQVQPVSTWAAAIRELVGSSEAYAAASQRCRQAASAFVAQGSSRREEFVDWLRSCS